MKQNRIYVLALYVAILLMPHYIGAQTSSALTGEIYREEGNASWYGEEFNGRPTASGEIFNSALFTAAHPSLPFGTFLIVTNIHNNRQITVKVNDRGPFVAGRIIDLSKAAAEHLDMINAGTAPVLIETLPSSYLPPPEPLVASSASVASVPVDQPPPAVEVIVPEPAPAEQPAEPLPPPYPPITINVYSSPQPQSQPQSQPQPPPPPPPQPVQAQPVQPVQQPQQIQPQPVFQPSPPPPQPVRDPYPVEPAVLPPQPMLPPAALTPPPEPAIKLIPDTKPLPGSFYRIQVGSYKIPRHEVEAFDKLKSAGLNPSYEPYGEFYRVVLAKVAGTEVQSVSEKLARVGFREALIRLEP